MGQIFQRRQGSLSESTNLCSKSPLGVLRSQAAFERNDGFMPTNKIAYCIPLAASEYQVPSNRIESLMFSSSRKGLMYVASHVILSPYTRRASENDGPLATGSGVLLRLRCLHAGAVKGVDGTAASAPWLGRSSS
eukprot:10631186-Karenia_brevis.AAC.1